MNKLTYPATLLAIACSIELTSASETHGIAWRQAGPFAVANANCTLLLAGAVMAAGAADSKPELPEDRALEQLAERDAFEAAQKLWAASAAVPLSARMLELAATLVASEDPFAAGLAEWALARRVAADNLGQDIQWPRENPPGWFQAWRHAVETRTLELDYARQGIALGLGRDSAGLVASAQQCLERARVAVADLARDDAAVVEGQGARRRWAEAQQRVEELERAVASAPRDVAQHRQLWLKVRLALREVVLHRAEIDFSRILYVRAYNGHSLRNITGSQYPWTHKPGGDVVAQDGLAPDAPTRALIRGRLGPGHVHGMDLSWDADRVIVGFAKQPHWPPQGNTQNGFDSYTLRKDQPPTQLYEIRLDSGEIQQLTDHPVWSDFEPTYCASGAIAFASDRSGRSSECGSFAADHTVINLYVVDPETRHVRRLSDNKDIDRYPHALADGTIGYTRWEYQERHFMEVHSIWRIRPDGTMADAVFKQHLGAPLSLRDVRSVPGGPLLVAVAAGHHTLAQGPVVVVDPRQGINRASALGIVTPNVRPQEGPMAGTPVPPGGVRDGGGLYQTPWALSDRAFLVSYTYDGVAGREGTFALYLIDVYGNKELAAS